MLKKGFYLEEIDKKNKALLCIDYMLEAIFNKDYETAEIQAKEFLAVIEMLKEIEVKKKRRAELEQLVIEMQERGIKIDFATKVHA
ncbi:hypothetical protein KN10_2774 [Anoxybacillus flavithermus NBRC 109594]|uniref:Uncharacterized protein n=1 Tax=Anoxybacillus flavithermus NBRC 109594 TaxID=1315967 RepID=R4G209_9BACL|nr:hypothetical protein [Anoxybacillus flavithermus]GAC92338.1 hypothetical protein KN10_2774 [Anoxybacillus flavithermus NBRC 109594]